METDPPPTWERPLPDEVHDDWCGFAETTAVTLARTSKGAPCIGIGCKFRRRWIKPGQTCLPFRDVALSNEPASVQWQHMCMPCVKFSVEEQKEAAWNAACSAEIDRVDAVLAAGGAATSTAHFASPPPPPPPPPPPTTVPPPPTVPTPPTVPIVPTANAVPAAAAVAIREPAADTIMFEQPPPTPTLDSNAARRGAELVYLKHVHPLLPRPQSDGSLKGGDAALLDAQLVAPIVVTPPRPERMADVCRPADGSWSDEAMVEMRTYFEMAAIGLRFALYTPTITHRDDLMRCEDWQVPSVGHEIT